MPEGGNEIVFGTCDGTGAIINVCLGFKPRRVEVWNIEDAGALYPHIEWQKGMELVTAMAAGVKWYTGTTYQQVGLLAATQGISIYNGGDVILYDGVTSNRWEAESATYAGASVEEVYVDGHYLQSVAGDPDYKCIGDTLAGTTTPRHGTKFHTPPGFTIAADGDVNADGEQIIWMAYR